MSGHTIQSSSPMNLLPSASSIVNLADSQERAAFANIMKMKEEPMDVESVDSNKEEVSKGQLLSIFYFKKKNMTWMQKKALFLWVGGDRDGVRGRVLWWQHFLQRTAKKGAPGTQAEHQHPAAETGQIPGDLSRGQGKLYIVTGTGQVPGTCCKVNVDYK